MLPVVIRCWGLVAVGHGADRRRPWGLGESYKRHSASEGIERKGGSNDWLN